MTDQQYRIIPGVGVGQYRFDDSIPNLVKKLDEPASIYSGGEYTIICSRNIKFWISNADLTISIIETKYTSKAFVNEILRIGADLNEIKKRYPSMRDEDDDFFGYEVAEFPSLRFVERDDDETDMTDEREFLGTFYVFRDNNIR